MTVLQKQAKIKKIVLSPTVLSDARCVLVLPVSGCLEVVGNRRPDRSGQPGAALTQAPGRRGSTARSRTAFSWASECLLTLRKSTLDAQLRWMLALWEVPHHPGFSSRPGWGWGEDSHGGETHSSESSDQRQLKWETKGSPSVARVSRWKATCFYGDH